MNKRTVGNDKEMMVIDYLKDNGYTVLEHGYRTRYSEVDIIAVKDDILAFVEVKYRKDERSGFPGESVGISKQKRICDCADRYVFENRKYYDKQIRFDCASILGDELFYHENAFMYCGKRLR